MHDKLLRGAIAGFLASIVQSIYGRLSQLIGFAQHSYHSFGISIVLSKIHNDFYSNVVGHAAHLIFDSLLGILFVYLVPKSEEEHPLIKAALFGMVVWLIIDAAGTVVFRIPFFVSRQSRDSLSTLVGGIVFGISLGLFLKLIRKHTHHQEGEINE